MSDAPSSAPVPDLILVTGMSGAGRSSVLDALEDLGFEAIDNLPIGLLDRLAVAAVSGGSSSGGNSSGGSGSGGSGAPLAVGVDIRTRDFAVGPLAETTARLSRETGMKVRTLFLDCDDEPLIRRFAETRRRHPLAADRPVADGIRLERRTLIPLRDMADLVLDTSELTIWDLKNRIKSLFTVPQVGAGPVVTVMSFAFRQGVPREADMVFDARFLDNPHYDEALRPLTGLDAPVGKHIDKDPDFAGFLDDITALMTRTLPRYEREGKSYLTLAIGCTGGRHRSVYTAECLADRLEAAGRRVHRFHRDLERNAGGSALPSDTPPSQSRQA